MLRIALQLNFKVVKFQLARLHESKTNNKQNSLSTSYFDYFTLNKTYYTYLNKTYPPQNNFYV